MLFFIFVTLITAFIYIDREVMPTVQTIGVLKAQELSTRAVNIAVSEVLENGIDYRDLVYIEKDHEGVITMMQANTITMNKIASDIGINIQDHLREMRTSSEGIPLGNVLGTQLFAQYGPRIKVQITPMGMVDVNFGTAFEQSGINQTRHRIFLIVTLNVNVIVPFNSEALTVTTTVPLAETVIVGRVPQTMFQMPNDNFLNISPLYVD